MTIAELNPQRVWKHFYALTQIPRPSKKEALVCDYMENFGKSLGLETIRDEVGNIIIRKPATPGMENRVGVIFQGHLDMVPQKNNDKVHDFEKDPIETRIVNVDGEDWVYANGTTLGADNGMGVAVAMAVLEATDLQHGPVECLFTIDEETGMTGAFALKPGLFNGDILINLDSETEGELYVGCAGGLDSNIEIDYTTEVIPAGYKAVEISVKGMRGGHSGMEINEGRGNANKTLARTILPILRDMDGKMVSITGGTLRNAIPREAFAVIAIPQDRVNEAAAQVAKVDSEIKAELASIDPAVVVAMADAEASEVISGNTALNMIKAILACPNGVERMSNDMEGLVETSNNLAVVSSQDGKITIRTLLRSSVDSAKYNLAEGIRSVFELAGAKVWFTGGYSGWKPNMQSAILATMKSVYNNMYGKEPEVMAIHAGLECGILGSKYPNWDMVSAGPTLNSPHSPDERCNVASVAKFWDFIVETLKAIPTK